jgi:predicted PurR-regulated permease PerM
VERKIQEEVPGFRLSDESKKSLEDLADSKKTTDNVFIAEAQARKAVNNDNTPSNNKTLKSILNSRITKIAGIIIAVILFFFLLRDCGTQKQAVQQVVPDTTTTQVSEPAAPEQPKAAQYPVLIGQYYGHKFVFDSAVKR